MAFKYKLDNVLDKVRPKLPDNMLFFMDPEVNLGQFCARNEIITPRNAVNITSQGEVEFNVPANRTDFINMNELKLKMTISLNKKDNFAWIQDENSDPKTVENITYASGMEESKTELAVPIDAFLQTQWKDVSLSLNGVSINHSNHDFPHRTYMDILLRTSEDQQPRLEYDWLFYKSFQSKRGDEPNPYVSKDVAGIKRSRRTRGGHQIQLSGRIWTDFLKNPKLLLPSGVAMNILLSPATDKFRFNITPENLMENFDYRIEDISLEVQWIRLSPNAASSVINMMNKYTIPYPFTRTEFKVFPLNKGRNEFHVTELFKENVPLDLVLGMVNVDAYYGNMKSDPFFFKRNYLETASFSVNGYSIPGKELKFTANPRIINRKTLTDEENIANLEDQQKNKAEYDIIDKSNEWAMEALHSLWNVAGTSVNGFNMDTYKDGNFLIAIQTEPTVPPDIPYWPSPKTGNTTLKLTFSKPLESEQQLLVLARFPSIVTITNGSTPNSPRVVECY